MLAAPAPATVAVLPHMHNTQLCKRCSYVDEPVVYEQAEYWRTRSEPESTWVEYGNDVEGSGFCKAGKDARDPLGKTDWNLQVLLM